MAVDQKEPFTLIVKNVFIDNISCNYNFNDASANFKYPGPMSNIRAPYPISLDLDVIVC
jgi:hypothetical protein